MGLVSTWLNGIGLGSAVPTFQAAGIVTPAALAELDVAHFEALGISNADDRRKLFYLVQRIKMAVNKDKSKQENSVEDQVDAVLSGAKIENEDQPVHESPVDQESGEIDEGEPRRSRRLKEKKEETTATKENRNSQGSPKRSARKTSKPKTTPILSESPTKSKRSSTKGTKKKTTKESTKETSDSPSKSKKSTSKSGKKKATKEKSDSPTKSKRPKTTKKKVSKETVEEAHASLQSEADKDVMDDSNTSNPVEKEEQEHKEITRETVAATGQRPVTARVAARDVFNLAYDDDGEELSPSMTTPIQRRSGLQQPKAVNKASADGERSASNVESISAPRRPESKLQNPGKSMRTGKQLSAIPSEKTAPMSPLSDVQMEAPEQQIVVQAQNAGRDTSRPRRRTSTGSGNSEALDNLLQSSSSDLDENKSESEHSSHHQRIRTKNSRPQSMARPGRRTSFSKTDSGRRMSEGLSRKSNIDSSTRSKPAPFVQGGTRSESWATKVEYLREDNNAEHELFQGQENQQLYEYDMRIRVIVRKRPLSKAEASLSGGVDVIHPLDYGEYGRVLVYQPKTRVDLTKEIETIPFAYDNVYDESSTNLQIYQRSLKSLIRPFFRGQWSTVFAYGQTGSGKTYTMMGSNMTGINAGTAKNDEENLGLYYLAALDIFEMIKRPEYQHLSLQVSLFEIYGGKLFDLLNTRRQVKCLEDSKGKACFPGLTEHPVDAPDDLMTLIEEGASNRSTGTTSRNADSSRSHAVLQLKLTKDAGRKKNVEHGRLNFIDLAGSERGADTSSASRATRLEGAEINTSLLALKEVIRALATGGSMTHIPFRGSRLTQVLKDSFVGENSRCCMVACVSPDIASCEQTVNTLRYADRVKERDPSSGALSNGYEEPIRLNLLTKTPSPRSQIVVSDGEVDEYGLRESSTEEFDEDDEYNIENEPPSPKVDLDYLLSADLDEIPQMVNESSASPTVSQTKHRAGADLITAHRAVMAKMFTMANEEMMLVNAVDADRDGLDDYLVQLEAMQSTQLNLISKLRNSLNRYATACEAPDATSGADVASDDDSFEDLRD